MIYRFGCGSFCTWNAEPAPQETVYSSVVASALFLVAERDLQLWSKNEEGVGVSVHLH